ncbi:hypothetical protein QCN29_29540 [Streptomyces sp. HNM0663]|uniref:WCX domain-containing protein n=1 Tax=Streptomyces chengmaiensis TaxID=3040919 RepID=A0ABT6HWZ3_9ACTN|nr:WYL domain-containing protein [Streptomyces chengmaiensis]MDH2392852.1 hypothetical protein [Streptomyces chengmaiensis]
MRLHTSAEQAARSTWPSDGVVETVDERASLLRTRAANLDVLVVHVMLTGVDCEVIEPQELTDHIRAVRDRLSRALDPDRAATAAPGAESAPV